MFRILFALALLALPSAAFAQHGPLVSTECLNVTTGAWSGCQATAPGIGAIAPVPAGSANGTPLGTPPAGTVGFELLLPVGSSVSFTIAGAQPTAPPPANTVFTAAQAVTGSNLEDHLSNGMMVYITAIVAGSGGAPMFRWE